MRKSNSKITPGGSVVRLYPERALPFRQSFGDDENILAITEHVERHLGPVWRVFHEIKSDLVHLDVFVVQPTPQRPCITLVTSGMSEAPMRMCDCCPQNLGWAELMISLPPDWPLNEAALKDERNFWPIRWLKELARLPHEYDTCLAFGHTVPNGDPAEPLAPGTNFIGFMVTRDPGVPEGFYGLERGPGKMIEFYAIEPLYAEEMQFKLMVGAEALITRFEQLGIDPVVNIHRRSACPTWRPKGKLRRGKAERN